MDVMTLGGVPERYAPRTLGQLGQAPVLGAGTVVGLLGLAAVGGLIYFVVASMGPRYTER